MREKLNLFFCALTVSVHLFRSSLSLAPESGQWFDSVWSFTSSLDQMVELSLLVVLRLLPPFLLPFSFLFFIACISSFLPQWMCTTRVYLLFNGTGAHSLCISQFDFVSISRFLVIEASVADLFVSLLRLYFDFDSSTSSSLRWAGFSFIRLMHLYLRWEWKDFLAAISSKIWRCSIYVCGGAIAWLGCWPSEIWIETLPISLYNKWMEISMDHRLWLAHKPMQSTALKYYANW